MNIAGMIAKYLATSLAIENVVSAPRVMSSCLPISTISMSLVGSQSRSTMLPASLAALVPGVHRHADIGLRERRRVVGAVAGHRDELAAGLLLADELHLGLGRRLREEVVDAGLLGDDRGGDRVVAGDHHGADAHRPQLIEALADAALHDVLEVDDAEDARLSRDTTSGVPPASETLRTSASRSLGTVPPSDSTHAMTASLAPLRICSPSDVDAAHPRLRGERDELGGRLVEVALADPELLGEHHDRATLGRLVGERRELRGVGELGLGHAGDRQELRRPAGCRG